MDGISRVSSDGDIKFFSGCEHQVVWHLRTHPAWKIGLPVYLS